MFIMETYIIQYFSILIFGKIIFDSANLSKLYRKALFYILKLKKSSSCTLIRGD